MAETWKNSLNTKRLKVNIAVQGKQEEGGANSMQDETVD
jgi:hypothetical protein